MASAVRHAYGSLFSRAMLSHAWTFTRRRKSVCRAATRKNRASARFFTALLVVAALLACSRPLRAEPGDELTVSVLTFGPGDHPFSKFGHDGLLVEDRLRGTSLVYNYGTYSFGSAWLIPKFLLGKYQYWLSVSPFSAVLAAYAAENRSVVAQRLALSASQKHTLAAFLAWNALEENKYYVFDYYRDNCATRVRNLIDVATDGAVHAATHTPASLTWREHTERLSADAFFVYLGLDLAMGGFIDQPITFWDEMFLPAKLEEGIRRTVIAADDASGGQHLRGLVEAETILVAARRPPPRASPPEWTKQFLAGGSTAAVALVLLGWGARRGITALRIGFGVIMAWLGLVLGFLGCLFLFLWIFTNHEVAYRNENILQCVPFALLLAWYGAATALGKRGASERAHRVARFAVVCSVAGLALKVLPWFGQRNEHLIAFFLPIWIGTAVATWLASTRRETSAPTTR
jgi:hypothetical protein